VFLQLLFSFCHNLVAVRFGILLAAKWLAGKTSPDWPIVCQVGQLLLLLPLVLNVSSDMAGEVSVISVWWIDAGCCYSWWCCMHSTLYSQQLLCFFNWCCTYNVIHRPSCSRLTQHDHYHSKHDVSESLHVVVILQRYLLHLHVSSDTSCSH